MKVYFILMRKMTLRYKSWRNLEIRFKKFIFKFSDKSRAKSAQYSPDFSKDASKDLKKLSRYH